jgi:hypothetical protein
LACLKPPHKAMQGRTACEIKGQAKACVSRGHDRLARSRALRGGFELRWVYSYKLGVSLGNHRKQSRQNGRKGRRSQNIYPKRQRHSSLFALRRFLLGLFICWRLCGGIAAGRAASLKLAYFANKAAVWTKDRSKMPSAFRAIFIVPWYFGAAVITKK